MVTFKDFDLDKLQSCLQYVVDSVAWLTEDDNFLRVSEEAAPELFAGITNKLERALRDVHGLHNRCVAINRIPVELLALIFREIQGPVPQVGFLVSNGGWVNINRVCRYWRRIAIFTPNLWTRLRISAASAVGDECYLSLSTSLLRSGVSPLSLSILDCSSATVIDQVFFAALLANMPRVQDLHLHGTDVRFLKHFRHSAPDLQTLEIFGHRHSPGSEYKASELCCAPFNGWQTPRLRTVKMTHCEAWRSMPMRHLRYLILSRIHFDLDTPTALFDVLVLNASLEDLILNELSAGSEHLAELEMLGRSRPRISMTKLKRVYIGASYLSLIEMIALPLVLNTTDGCAICYSIDLEEFSERHVSGPLSPSELFTPCRQLYVTEDGVVGVDNRSAFWTLGYVTDPLYIGLMRSPYLALQVRELWILCYEELHVVPLQRLSLVTKLVILEGHGGTVLPWLQNLLSVDDSLPELKELWLQIDIEDDDQTEALDLVLQFLRRRDEAGRRVHTLSLFRMADNSPTPVLRHWRKYSSPLANVVDEVTFRSLEEHPQLDVPRICREPSPVHTDWLFWP